MRKVAILGRAPTWELAPFSDPSWEIWGLPWQEMPRADRLFEVHCQSHIDNEVPPEQADETWIHWSRESYPDVPVYCDPTRAHLFGKNAVEYPVKEVQDFFPPGPWLESSISYMAALALYEGVDVLGFWGVNQIGRGEFQWHRPSTLLLIGFAYGRGVKVEIAPGSPLLMSGYVAGRYGQPGGMRLEKFVNMSFGPSGTQGYMMEKVNNV